ncbi:Hypothetical predicted protein [Paramuricea clavata]|uniref:Uncharacterized protein n=1 Tax=Paramuricea clavata TaxID=317549 RepID=A0A6S7HQH6_PARCT|nr:Hypothetical predicted protein [Paramuricea clavata]
MQKIFDGYEFYFMPKKQIHTQVHILMKRIEEQGGVITDLQRDTTTHIVISKGSMSANHTVNKDCTPQQYHLCVDWIAECLKKGLQVPNEGFHVQLALEDEHPCKFLIMNPHPKG